jgi:hypothetical protein
MYAGPDGRADCDRGSAAVTVTGSLRLLLWSNIDLQVVPVRYRPPRSLLCGLLEKGHRMGGRLTPRLGLGRRYSWGQSCFWVVFVEKAMLPVD